MTFVHVCLRPLLAQAQLTRFYGAESSTEPMSPKKTDSCTLPSAPPGLSNISAESDVDKDAQMSALPQGVIRPPPGLEDMLNLDKIDFQPPPGLPFPQKAKELEVTEPDTDDTSEGFPSREGTDSSTPDSISVQGDGPKERQEIFLSIAVADVTQLKKDAPLFVPWNMAPETPEEPAEPRPNAQKLSLDMLVTDDAEKMRTPLKSASKMFVPGSEKPKPFVPMADMTASWETQDMTASWDPSDMTASWSQSDVSASWGLWDQQYDYNEKFDYTGEEYGYTGDEWGY